jgi:type IV secretion system protein VirB5
MVFAAAVLGSASVANAGIPVIDGANLANSVQQVIAWGKQFQQMREQYTHMQQQFESMNGSRGIAGLLNNPQLYNYLPQNFQSVLSADGSGGINASALMTQLQVQTIGDTGLNPGSAAGKLFQNSQNQNAVFRMLGERGYSAMNQRLNQLSSLTSRIDSATDPKAIADLQARISAEQGFIANEQAKLNILAQMQAAQDRIRQQQSREVIMQSSKGPMVPSGW